MCPGNARVGLLQRKKIEAVPLSNDVIHPRTVDMSSNTLNQVMEELAATPFPFSMQLDETTDIMKLENYDLKNDSSPCTDGAHAVLGNTSGLTV